MIRRCGSRSLQYWSAQLQEDGAPTDGSKRRLYQAAVQVRRAQTACKTTTTTTSPPRTAPPRTAPHRLAPLSPPVCCSALL